MSLVLTLTQSLRARYATNSFDKLENRRSQYGVYQFFKDQSARPSSILTPDIRRKAETSFGNVVQVPFIDAGGISITNTRSCTIPGFDNTSRLINLVWSTYAFTFDMFPSQYENNDIGYQQDFDNKYEKGLIALAATLDTQSRNVLETGKNTYFPPAITAYYPVTGNALQVLQAEKNDFFNNANAITTTMDFPGNINVIGGTQLMPMVNRLIAQGDGNAVNERFQFNGYNWYYSNRVTNGTGVQATGYLVPDDYVGMLSRVDPDARIGRNVGNGMQRWGTVQAPIVDLELAAYSTEGCADGSAINSGTTGLTRTYREGYEFSVDVCWIIAPNSSPSTRYTPDAKFEISQS